MPKKPYSPVAPYKDLKRVEAEINQADTVDKIRALVAKDGPQVGYKALCYILGGKMTPEAMKPDEACAVAADLEQEGKHEAAMNVYKKVIEVYPDHPIAKSKITQN